MDNLTATLVFVVLVNLFIAGYLIFYLFRKPSIVVPLDTYYVQCGFCGQSVPSADHHHPNPHNYFRTEEGKRVDCPNGRR